MSKKRILAHILSFVLLFTTVFTGNIVVKADGVASIGEDAYYDGNGYIGGEAADVYENIVVPRGCCLRIEKPITVTGTVTVSKESHLEIMEGGRLTCNSLVVNGEDEGASPEIHISNIDNAPIIGGNRIVVYNFIDGEMIPMSEQNNWEWDWANFRYDFDGDKWLRFDPYDEFWPMEGERIVEIALIGFDRYGEFPIAFSGINQEDTMDAWNRMKARVHGDSLTISWSAEEAQKPLQICVEDAFKLDNGEKGWLIVDLDEEQTSYTIDLSEPDRDFYYVEVKYNFDQNSMDIHDIDVNLFADLSEFADNSPNFGFEIFAFEGDEQGPTNRIDSANNYINFDKENNNQKLVAHIPENAEFIGFRILDAGQIIDSASYTIREVDCALTNGEINDLRSEGGFLIPVKDESGWLNELSLSIKLLPNGGNNPGGDNPGGNQVIHDINVNFSADLSVYSDNSIRFGFETFAFAGDEQGPTNRIEGTNNYTNFDKENNNQKLVAHIPEDAEFIGFRISDAGQIIDSASYTIGGVDCELTNGEINDLRSEGGFLIPVKDESGWLEELSFSVKILPNGGNNPGGDNPGGNPGDNQEIHDINVDFISDLSVYADDAIKFGFDIFAAECDEKGSARVIEGVGDHTDFDKANPTRYFKAHIPGNADYIGFRILDAGEKIESASYTIGELKYELNEEDIRNLSSGNGFLVRVRDGEAWVGAIVLNVKLVPAGPENDEYPELEGANVFVNSNVGGMIGELKFNNVNICMNGSGTKGTQKIEDADEYAVSLQLEFGAAATAITINGVRYSGDSLVPVNPEGDKYLFTVKKADNGIYNIEFERGESNLSTIIWTYNPEDPKGPNGDTYSEDALVLHGHVEIVTITRGDRVLYDKGAYCEGVDPEKDKVVVDINNELQRGYVRLNSGDDIVIRLVPEYGYQLTQATINERVLEPKSTDFSDVSTFILSDVRGQMHFAGVFGEKEDTIETNAEHILTATITDGENAAGSGNLSLSVTDAKEDPEAVAVVSGSDDKNDYAVLATLDMTLTNVVSMGPDRGDWENAISEFENDITVGLELTGIALAEGEELVVVREHDGEYDILSNVCFEGDNLQVPTNRFSKYTIIKQSEKKQVNITYELGDGENDRRNPTEYAPELGTITLFQPTKEGSVFEGWFKDAKYTEPISELDASITEDITIYAKWNFIYSFYGYQLVIDSNFDLKLIIEVSEAVKADSNAYVEFTVGGSKQRATYSAISGSYATYICEVPSKCISDRITASLHFNDAEYEFAEFSIKDYLEFLIDNSDTTPEYAGVKALAEAILTYGAYSQLYFEYNTEMLANVSLEDDPVEEASEKEIIEAINMSIKVTENEDFEYVGASLVCNSDTFVRIYLTNKNNLTIEEILEKYNYYVVGGSNPVYDIFENNGNICLELQNIPAAELDNTYIFMLAGEDNNCMIEYSPYIYFAQVMETDNTNLKNLCKSLYLYSVAANEYYNKYSLPR